MIDVSVNGKTQRVDAEPDTPLLWVIRESLGLTGTKYGCGMALCGACTVHLDGAPVRSCVTACNAVRNRGRDAPPADVLGRSLDRDHRRARDVDTGNHDRVSPIRVQDDLRARRAGMCVRACVKRTL